ncbi:MAG: biotin transporter BioY [Chloroflexaceae bacterium]|nr:biotin transporter BioY [Chloroflexaceae bacterium]
MAYAGTHTSGTLAQQVLPRQGILSNKWVADLVLVAMGSWFVALCAQISIPLPFTPVPITLQTLAVLMAGGLLGSRLGALALMFYAFQGAIGLPFFADGRSGWEVLHGATAGYIVGFVIAAAVVGWLAERGWDRRILTMVVVMVIGNIIIFALGVGWLAVVMGSLPEALVAGFYPFIPGGIIKIAVAAIALPGGWQLLKQSRMKE